MEKKQIRLHKRVSDVGHVVETEIVKYKQKQVVYDPMAFKNCKTNVGIRKYDSSSYLKIEVDDF
jgi:hypothetical protein